MGRHSPGHVCRRPRQQHSHENRSCSQPCRHQQDQQIQPIIRNLLYIFTPVAIEIASAWHHQAVELVRDLGRRATIITGDSREITYLFQQLSVALQKGNAVSFQNTFTAGWPVATSYVPFFTLIFSAYGFVIVSRVIKIIIN